MYLVEVERVDVGCVFARVGSVEVVHVPLGSSTAPGDRMSHTESRTPALPLLRSSSPPLTHSRMRAKLSYENTHLDINKSPY